MNKVDDTNGNKCNKSASSWYEDGCRCSQAVLITYSEQLGLKNEIALKIATGFGGGISRLGEVCGAVTGAVMAIGLKYGQTKIEDEKAKEITYYLVEEFVDRFKSRNGSLTCKELIGCDLNTPEGIRRFREEKLNETICKKYVEDASQILEEIFNYWDDTP